MMKKYCKQKEAFDPQLSSNISEVRRRFIVQNHKKWANGTNIKFYFVGGPESQRAIVRLAFNEWKKIGIGISFTETPNIEESIARIGFDLSDGSWSFVGRDNLKIPKSELTMNFGWDLTASSYGMTTALHEIGHLIGFEHEHQSPFSGIEWNIDAVYKEFEGSPNYWSKKDINNNILKKMPPNQVKGSVWDPKSIMEYEFNPGLVVNPKPYDQGIFPPGIISANDIKGVQTFYPLTNKTALMAKTNKLQLIKAKTGQQADFEFIPKFTKKYTFQTVGELDTVMVISEKGINENYYLAGDDDTGTDQNAKITLPLIQNRKYLINVRVVFSPNPKNGSLLII